MSESGFTSPPLAAAIQLDFTGYEPWKVVLHSTDSIPDVINLPLIYSNPAVPYIYPATTKIYTIHSVEDLKSVPDITQEQIRWLSRFTRAVP